MTTPDTEPPSDPSAPAEDGTLGGYLAMHDRPPAFEGPDGHPYTVSLEVEQTGDLRAPSHAYLVFPRWAATGVGIVGHVESPTLLEARSSTEAVAHLEGLSLHEVRRILDAAVRAVENDPTTIDP